MTVTMNFNDPFDVAGGATIGNISGNLNIDYTTMQATGTISVTINPGNPGAGTYSFSGPFSIANVGGNYALVGGTYTQNPINPFEVTANGPNGVVNLIWPNTSQSPSQVIGNYLVSGSTVNISTGQVVNGTLYQDTNLPVTTSVVCFAAGTLIRTVRGDVPVESLVVGDEVITVSGERRPIIWLGHRKIDFADSPNARALSPIRVRAHAFGAGLPERDLFLSPGHGICVACVEEVLIPVSLLVTGTIIDRVEVDQIEYWHVELETHDILLANGLPSESYLEMNNRSFFLESNVVAYSLPNSASRSHADMCRPFVENGAVLEAVRSQLASRADMMGWKPDIQADLRLLVDGTDMLPLGAGNSAVFLIPSSAREVRLVSRTFIPANVGSSQDERVLGVMLRGLSISDGNSCRSIPFNDPRLDGCFYPEEGNDGVGWRWTNGDMKLSPSLWEGLSGEHISIHISYEEASLRGWIAPSQLHHTRSVHGRQLAIVA